MLKYTDTLVTFSEVPDEVSLCINITGCQIHCPGCHSKHLWQDEGNLLTREALDTLIRNNEGISCVCFMGGDHNEGAIILLCKYVKRRYRKQHLKTAWYSGKDSISKLIERKAIWFDFIKIGSYKEELGGLDSYTTNQVFFEVTHDYCTNHFRDITYKFTKDKTESTRPSKRLVMLSKLKTKIKEKLKSIGDRKCK